MNPARVAIILVNWNGLADTLACLESLAGLSYPAYEIILVDNGSTDPSVDTLRRAWPQVRLTEAGTNLGFVGGNNLALRQVLEQDFDYALLLNNDTEVAPDFLDHLVQAAEADPGAAIAGPNIFYFSQPEILWSAGGKIDWQRGQTVMTGIGQKAIERFDGPPRAVDYVTGCALLIKTPVARQIGLLDERFFAYYEEVEWCARARRAGYRVLQVPSARVWHKISPEAREASAQVHYYMTRNRLLLLRLAGAGWSAWLHTLLIEYARTLASWSLRPKWRHKAAQRRAMLRAIADFWKGNFGRVDLPKTG